MMGKTLLTYLVKHFLGTFLLVAFTFVTLVILADIVDHLDGFLAYNLPLSDYFLYYLYTMPNILVVCLPLSSCCQVFTCFECCRHPMPTLR